ncbi:MAG: hypothetical protein LCH93_13825 [Proteobacteria bacterium]|nr:hypothetical protein [Pseudomonadota bacterium]
MPSRPSDLIRGAIAGAATAAGDWFYIEHAGGLYRVSRAELWLAIREAIHTAGPLVLAVNVAAPTLEAFSGDINISRVTFPYGYIIRPNVAGYKKLRFAVVGGGPLEEIALLADVVLAPNIATTANAANAYLDPGNNNSLLRSTSTQELKTDIEPLDAWRADKVVDDAAPIWYRSTAPADNPDWGWYGLTAEQMAEVDPRLVVWGYADSSYENVPIQEPEGTVKVDRRVKAGAVKVPLGVAYERLAVMLLDVVRREKSKVATLQGEVAALSARVDALES